jgi:hypothetical protein
MAEGLPVRFKMPVKAVSLVGDSLALVVTEASFGENNLLVLGPEGDELARLGTTCGTGFIDQVLDVSGEIRVIEATPRGDYQARLDLDSLTLERTGEWR